MPLPPVAERVLPRVVATEVYFLPISTRLPLKFGAETVTSVTCARVRLRVEAARGAGVSGNARAEGWGETPLSVQWVWPSRVAYEERHECFLELCRRIAACWPSFRAEGHPLETGHAFLEGPLHDVLNGLNRERAGRELVPWLAALVAASAFDLALHDAYANLVGESVYDTYGPRHLDFDLRRFLEPAEGSDVSFDGKRPADYLARKPLTSLVAWHLVGGRDAVEPEDLDGTEPLDGYPTLLRDWIRTDGLIGLKVKLRGDDAAWDLDRLLRVARIAREEGARWLSADFNCTVHEPEYVNGVLDRLRATDPAAFDCLLYVEQPFPYELESHPIDVRTVAARKLLFLDESAHDWKLVRRGRSLGWTGVALKTCKTQTGAILSLCWAKAHGMSLMVQDLTNPRLAQIPHVLLAAHAETLLGVETNAMQFYPEASRAEAEVHPGLYRRREGRVDLSSIRGTGFGYRLDEIRTELPKPAAACG